MVLLLAACAPLRPDEGHVLVLRPKERGGDYLMQIQGQESLPIPDSEPPADDVIHRRMSDAEIEAFLRKKIAASPLREDQRRFTIRGSRLVNADGENFLETLVDYTETRYFCNKHYAVLVSAEGIPQRIYVVGLSTCPL